MNTLGILVAQSEGLERTQSNESFDSNIKSETTIGKNFRVGFKSDLMFSVIHGMRRAYCIKLRPNPYKLFYVYAKKGI